MAEKRIIAEHHVFVKTVAGALRRKCCVGAGARIVVATSGGPDSVAMLRALVALRGRRGWGLELIAGHVQHHLREEAEGEAGFVAELGERLGVRVMRADIEGLADRGGNLEATARRERYAALGEMAKESGAGFVATGHHGDDQLETMLMRLLRGSSVRGMAGMAWKRRLAGGAQGPWLIRPMLGLDREAVLGFLRDIDQAWCDDVTNRSRDQLRARLRQDVLPVLREIRPDVARRAQRTAEQLHRVAGAVDERVERAIEVVTKTGGVDEGVEAGAVVLDRWAIRRLMGDGSLLPGVLRRVLVRGGVGEDRLGSAVLDPVVRAVGDGEGGRRVFAVGGDTSVVVERDTVTVAGGGSKRPDTTGRE